MFHYANIEVKSGIGKETIWIVLLCLAAFFVNNSCLPSDIMECRNLVTAREMVSDGHWLVPTMNGELRLEKPLLPTWIAAVVEAVRPHDIGAQRAVAGIMAMIWTFFVYAIAVYTTKKRSYARTVVIIFVTCYNIVLMGRTATWDIFCHAFMMGGIYFLIRMLYDESGKRIWLWGVLSGLLMGLSFQSKGPVSFYALLLPFVIALLFMQERRKVERGRWKPLLLVVFLVLLSSWWYVILLLLYREEAQTVFNKEASAWSGHNVRPWYYYWRFFAETGVWALLTLVSLAVPLWRKIVSMHRHYLWSVIWMVATVILLSLMPEKKMRYLLPVMASCAFVVAHLIDYYEGHRQATAPTDKVAWWIFRVNGYVIALTALAASIAVYVVVYGRGMTDLGTAVFVSMLILAVAVWMFLSVRRQHARHFVYAVGTLFLIAECFLLQPVGNSFGNNTRQRVRELANMEEVSSLSFYHDKSEAVNIIFVYEVEKKVLPLDFGDGAGLLRSLPCVVVTQKPLREELSADVLAQVDTLCVGIYDNNTHTKNFRHYRTDNIYRVSILKKRQP